MKLDVYGAASRARALGARASSFFEAVSKKKRPQSIWRRSLSDANGAGCPDLTQRVPSFNGPSFDRAPSSHHGRQFGQREPAGTPRRVFFSISGETIRL